MKESNSSQQQVVTPYGKGGSKKEEVAEMFDNIAQRYDFLNHLLSAGIDKGWRKSAMNVLRTISPKMVLDVATGTGDFALATHKALHPHKIVGVDISNGMLAVGQRKIQEKELMPQVELVYGDSEHLEFEDHTFDAITCAFGVRNFGDLPRGLSEMARVMKPGGKCVILEFGKPRGFIGPIFQFYFKAILPNIGRFFSKDPRAYTYLPESVKHFPDRKKFTEIMDKAGFINTSWKALTFGICYMYIGEKQA